MIPPALARRRAREALQGECLAYVDHNAKVSQVVAFEQRTAKRIECNNISRKAEGFRQKDSQILQDRQKAMVDLYNREMVEWERQVKEKNTVTTEERMEEMRSKALRLRETREADRKKYISTCYERQWRASSEEARKAESQAILNRLLKERGEEATKPSHYQTLEREAKRLEALELEQRKKELDQHASDAERKIRERNVAMKQALNLQVAAKSQREKDLALQRQQEEAENIQRIENEKWMVLEAEKVRLRKQEEARREIIQENAAKFEGSEEREAKEEDLRLLDFALQKEQREIVEEAAAKEQGVGMAREYMAFLQEQMKKDHADTNRINAIREAKAEQMWSQRDAELAAQSEARRRMMAEVDASRRIQMKQQIAQIERERKEVAQYVAECVEAARKQITIDKEKQTEATAATISIANTNAKVAAERKKRHEEEQVQQALLERKAREYDERKHGQRLRELLG
mmetsp:Transcript_20334/g.58373  ORF Transcript_20334/g.58373 Transcript_20334/m.58373 type:complete len:462 (-) Transcript_20334:2226-3611(-)